MKNKGIVTFNARVNSERSTIVWQMALDAANNLSHRQPVDYLLDTPLSAEYLEEGLSKFGKSYEGFSHLVTSMTAPVASGWSVRRVEFKPTGKTPSYRGAHPLRLQDLKKLTAKKGGEWTCPWHEEN